jgi:DUF4097 and DUF4098 domain-containing protein YvlB
MKPFTTTTLALAACAVLWAQDIPGDRVVVPPGNSSRPRMVNISLMNGGITVKTHSGKEVIVETQTSTDTSRRGSRDRDREPATTPDGLRRLDLPWKSGLEVEADDNVIKVRTRPNGNASVVVTVPVDTSLKLHTLSGAINVDGVHGELDIDALNGGVTLANISGTVLAHSLNGALKVSMNQVDPSKPISFSTLNGEIDVTLPPDIKANVKLKTDHGDIYSDFDIKMDLSNRGAVTEKNSSPDGKFRVKIDRTMYGTINGGGPEASFQTFNGRIAIRKKK